MFQLVSSSDEEDLNIKLVINRAKVDPLQSSDEDDSKSINHYEGCDISTQKIKDNNYQNYSNNFLHKLNKSISQSTPTLHSSPINKLHKNKSNSNRSIEFLMSSSESEIEVDHQFEESFSKLNLSETLPLQLEEVSISNKLSRQCQKQNISSPENSPALSQLGHLSSESIYNIDIIQSPIAANGCDSIESPNVQQNKILKEIKAALDSDISLEIVAEFKKSPINSSFNSEDNQVDSRKFHNAELSEIQIQNSLTKVELEKNLEELASKIRQTHVSIATLSAKLPDGGSKLRQMLADLLEQQKKIKNLYNYQNSDVHSNGIGWCSEFSLPPSKMVEDWRAPENCVSQGSYTLKKTNRIQAVNETLSLLHKATLKQENSRDQDLYHTQVRAQASKLFALPLMDHQVTAVGWMAQREAFARSSEIALGTEVEHGTGSGGILADDMGLGKTLTTVALILLSPLLKNIIKSDLSSPKALADDCSSVAYQDGFLNKKNPIGSGFKDGQDPTLIICPASVIYQWESEIKKYCRQAYTPKVLLYHGPSRTQRHHHIANHDIVITTYGLAGKEITSKPNSSPLARLQWHRVVLDEGHTIKNPKAQCSLALYRIKANYRWILTGTPVHNNLKDLFSLLKFLRLQPFAQEPVWKEFISGPLTTTVNNDLSLAGRRARARLALITRSLCLRRTKEERNELGATLLTLPKRQFTVHNLTLSGEEAAAYKKIHAVAYKFLQGIADRRNRVDRDGVKQFTEENGEPVVYNTAGMLVHLLRMRQCCCHPNLLAQSAQLQEYDSAILPPTRHLKSDPALNCLEDCMGGLSIGSTPKPQIPVGQQWDEDEKILPGGVDDNIESAYGLTKDSPMLQENYESTKLKALLDHVLSTLQPPTGEKCLIVSQWPSFLDLLARHLEARGFKRFAHIRGSVKPVDRAALVKDFNENPDGSSLILLSLTAGGVGLNLVGANHVYFADLHWNPALEAQACDRVYRPGQTRPVYVHKFVCSATIEQRITELQERKSALARQVFTNTATLSAGDAATRARDAPNIAGSGFAKLSLEDMKALLR